MPHITCKRWHKWSNQLLTCATLKIKTFCPIKWCRVSWRKSLKNPPIKLWHVSPIKLHHVLLTYPQTPINKSLPKAFLDTKTSWKTPRHLEYKQHKRKFKNTEALLKSSLKACRNFKNFNFKYKEHSKRNHPNHFPRSQSSLESSSKAFRNFKKPQINEALRI